MPFPQTEGRRVRLPISLLYSHHHSPLAVAAYALIDVMSGPGRPCSADRSWMAGRLGCSEGGLKKALGSLTREHDGSGLKPPAPAFLVSTVRGSQLTAAREVLPGIPKVDVPEWSIGFDAPRVEPKLWRLYAAYLDKRAPGKPWCSLRRREIAQLVRVRPDTVPGLQRDLVAARMILVQEVPGKESVVQPVMEELTGDGYQRAAEALAGRFGKVCGQPDTPPLYGSVTPPSYGAVTPPLCGSTTPPLYGAVHISPSYVDPLNRPAEEPPATPLRGTGASETRTPRVVGVYDQPWCGKCLGPRRRVLMDDETGNETTTPCPRCSVVIPHISARVGVA